MSVFLVMSTAIVMLGTAFVSGLFGMVGGLLLIGFLLLTMPLPAAMVLHAITQMASNGWRAFLWRRHIRWRAVMAYVSGVAVALAAWSVVQFVPSTPMALILLGVTPFLLRLVPANLRPNPESFGQGILYGWACMALMLVTGVAGPLLDTYFLGGKLDRREIVATKAACQVTGHLAKLVYFGSIIDQAAALDPLMGVIAVVASMAGTTLARRLLEAMSDQQFRLWAGRLVTSVCLYYTCYGSYLYLIALRQP